MECPLGYLTANCPLGYLKASCPLGYLTANCPLGYLNANCLVTARQTVRLVTSRQTVRLVTSRQTVHLVTSRQTVRLVTSRQTARKTTDGFGVERAQRTLLRSKEKPHHCWRNEMIIINSFCKAYLRPLARVALFCAPRGGWEGGGTGDPMPFFYTTQRGPHAIPLSRVQAIPSGNVFQGR